MLRLCDARFASGNCREAPMYPAELKSRFVELYGDGGEIRLFFAPGRVNLIGEHTDYNGGHVFPCALTIGVYAAVRTRADRYVHVASLNKRNGEIRTFDLDGEIQEEEHRGWTRYVKGVFRTFAKNDYSLPCGLDILYDGDLPIGAGLGSSSALEVATGMILRSVFDYYTVSNAELAQICRDTENEYAGVMSGIMDPFASLMGRKDCGIFLATSSLRYEYVPLRLGNNSLVITDSGVKHGLSESRYNLRREECEKALKKLRVVANIESLCDLSTDRFESCKDVIMNETYMKRARHAVYENARTVRAISALRVGNLSRFGMLMNQSHISLRDDYEVSCPEMDFLVSTAWETEGVLGSRMTGGGFGGSTVSIVADEALDRFQERLADAYKERFGLEAKFYVVRPGDGARELVS